MDQTLANNRTSSDWRVCLSARQYTRLLLLLVPRQHRVVRLWFSKPTGVGLTGQQATFSDASSYSSFFPFLLRLVHNFFIFSRRERWEQFVSTAIDPLLHSSFLLSFSRFRLVSHQPPFFQARLFQMRGSFVTRNPNPQIIETRNTNPVLSSIQALFNSRSEKRKIPVRYLQCNFYFLSIP